MKMSLSGAFELKIPLDKAFKFLTDSNNVSRCIPDSDNTKVVNKTVFSTSLNMGIGLIKGSFVVRCEIKPHLPNLIFLLIEGSGVGSKLKVGLSLELTKKSQTLTSVSWEADAEMSGLIGGVGENLLKNIGESKIEEIVKRLKENAK